MAEGQDWCTQCGERADGSLRKRAGWASAGVLTAASAILASGAAAAGVAALTQGSAKEAPHAPITAQAPVTTTTVSPASPPPAVNPGSPETLKTTHTATPAHLGRSANTPASSGASPAPAATGNSNPTTSESATSQESRQTSTTTHSAAASEAAELQGLTASAYSLNPEYPKATLEGPENDPSRALEGRESGTEWKVTVKPGTAENLNVGLLVALGGATRVGSVEVHTSTPGFPLEIYGTTNTQPPAAITGWTRLALTPSLKASATLKVGTTGTRWRYVLLWIPKVGEGLHHVALGEVALFAPTG
jgi:hypothetical protein